MAIFSFVGSRSVGFAVVMPVVAVTVPLLYKALAAPQTLKRPSFEVCLDVLKHVVEARGVELVADQADQLLLLASGVWVREVSPCKKLVIVLSSFNFDPTINWTVSVTWLLSNALGLNFLNVTRHYFTATIQVFLRSVQVTI